jgi:hypothetical protein
MKKILTPKIQLILLLSFPRMQHLTKILLLFAIILLASCGKQLPDSMSGIIVSKEENGSEVDPTESLKVSAKSLTFLAEGGSNNFTITSNTSWTITSDQSWCTLSPSSGSGNSSISVNVQENTSTQLRSATLSMKADEITQTIPVTQAGANQSSITFTVSGVSFKMIRVDGGVDC